MKAIHNNNIICDNHVGSQEAFLQLLVVFVGRVVNVSGMFARLNTQFLQPQTSTVFCNMPREIDWCKFHVDIAFSSRVRTLMSSTCK